jgi:hypothetical protein
LILLDCDLCAKPEKEIEMKYRDFFTRSFVMITFLGVALAAAGVWLTTYVKAFNPQPDPPAFGLISLSPGQSLRLNVVNRLTPPPDPDRSGRGNRHAILGFDLYLTSTVSSASIGAEVPPGPCVTAHHFVNRQSCEVTLAPGEATSFDLPSATAMGIHQVLPAVQDDDNNQHPALIYTLEVLENGKTLYTVPAVQNTWAGRAN